MLTFLTHYSCQISDRAWTLCTDDEWVIQCAKDLFKYFSCELNEEHMQILSTNCLSGESFCGRRSKIELDPLIYCL